MSACGVAVLHTLSLAIWCRDGVKLMCFELVLSREMRVPNKDLVKLFIRAHALRSNSLVNSPWIVEENFVRKHSLPPVVYPSPHKVLN